MRLPVLLACCFFACGGDDTDPDGFECSKSARTGTYLITYVETTGDCGGIDPELGQITNGEPALEPACGVDFRRWSDGDCALETSQSCDITSGPLAGATISYVDWLSRAGHAGHN